MKTTALGSLIGAFISIVCVIAVAQAEIKVGIAGPLSGSALNTGEQQEIGAQKAISHLNDKGGLAATGERGRCFGRRACLLCRFPCCQQDL